MTDEHLELWLVGWYVSAGHGYSFPLFGQNEGANTLYIARCSIPGDHQGTIAGFEPVDAHDYDRIPDGRSIRLAVGDPWHDVFVWKGVGYVGTPDALWAELNPYLGDLEEKAPLSCLDLALHADRIDEVRRLAPLALTYVDERFERAKANHWRKQLLRQWLETKIRRDLAAHDFAEEIFRSIAVMESSPDALTAIPPTSLLKALTDTGTIDNVSESLAEMAEALGADITLRDASDVATTAGEGAVEPDPTPVSVPKDPASFSVDFSLIAAGHRSREIVRHLRRHLNAPGDLAMSAIGTDRLIISDVLEQEGTVDRFERSASTIMLLVDEEDPEWARSGRFDRYLHEQMLAGAVTVFVPALPVRYPSRIFDGGDRMPKLARQCHAILDSSIARSPFWWGKSKRSFDRRIANLITVAAAACRSPGLREELRARPATDFPPILAVGLVPKHDGGFGGNRLGSEATWVSSDPKRRDPAILFSLNIDPGDVGLHGADGRVLAEGRRNLQRFADFSTATVAHILERSRRGRGIEPREVIEVSSVPESITNSLAFPRQCRAFREIGSVAHAIKLAVVGETPTVAAVTAADHVGWRIARYTDAKTIGRVLKDSHGNDALPDEIDMGTIHSTETNRWLVTRGVDRRDVHRVSHNLFQEWLSSLPDDSRYRAHEATRRMRSATQPHGDPDGDYLVMREYVWRKGDPVARSLAELLRRERQVSPRTSPLKRATDLRRCWTAPSHGFRRFALVDGSIPVLVVKLDSNQVPVENMFVIDGDEAVPALFRSRVFRIWARATLPSTNSWMARFSITVTFGGFPIVEPFRIVGQDGDAAALVVDGAPGRFYGLSEDVGKQIAHQLARLPPNSWKSAHELGVKGDAMDHVNEMILEWYGLSIGASDIAILKRLQELNASLD